MKIAVIPARGGSKRIPRKNIKLFAGKPVVTYSILAAQQADIFDHIIVSTDDDEIAGIATEWGAEVPFKRPKVISDDFTGTNTVVKHAIGWMHDHGKAVDYACCIYATAPMLQPVYLKRGLELLENSDRSYAFSVTTFPFPIQRALRIRKDGGVEAISPEDIPKRSQDLEEAFHDAGQFYWGRAEAFVKDVAIFSPKSLPVQVPRYLVQDIDTPEDWRRAELLYKAWQIEGASP